MSLSFALTLDMADKLEFDGNGRCPVRQYVKRVRCYEL